MPDQYSNVPVVNLDILIDPLSEAFLMGDVNKRFKQNLILTVRRKQPGYDCGGAPCTCILYGGGGEGEGGELVILVTMCGRMNDNGVCSAAMCVCGTWCVVKLKYNLQIRVVSIDAEKALNYVYRRYHEEITQREILQRSSGFSLL